MKKNKYKKQYNKLVKFHKIYCKYLQASLKPIVEQGDHEDDKYVYKYVSLPLIKKKRNGEPVEKLGHGFIKIKKT